LSIRANDESRRNDITVYHDPAVTKARTFRPPKEGNTNFLSPFDQQLMKNRSAQTYSSAIRKIGNNRRLRIRKTNSSEPKAGAGRYGYT
jgi:hypothetical protein